MGVKARRSAILRMCSAAVVAVALAGSAAAPGVAAVLPTADPIGQIDQVSVAPGRVTARGWAVDADAATSPIIVQMFVDGRAFTMTWAKADRPDLAVAYPAFGPLHGFSLSMSVPAGPHTVCVYAVNAGPGTSTSLGCRSVDVPDHDPVGQVDRVTAEPGRVVARGWAADPDSPEPVVVQAYVDWRANALGRAGEARPDVARALPWAGAARGYSVAVDAQPGDHTVCVYAVNVGSGASRAIGCRRVTVPGHDPIGNVETVTVDGGRVTATGWVIDPDTAGPVIAQLYVDGSSTMTWASTRRTDVAGVYPWAGAEHGFTLSLDVAPGAHRVCVYGINHGPGASRALGCRTTSGPPFFVYGSLRTGQSGYHLLAGRTVRQTETRMPGLDLYRRSGSAYPYAVPNEANAAGVVGEAMDITPSLYASTVVNLDRYERYNPGLPPENQIYVRELRTTREGRAAWVYVAGPRQAQYLRSVGILVTSGDFLRW